MYRCVKYKILKGLITDVAPSLFTKKLMLHAVVRFKSTYARETEPEQKLQKIWTLPNFISIGRIAMAPLLGYFVLKGQSLYAFYLIVGCGFSDFVDGWIARRLNQQSALGSVLDPLGDKLLVGTLAITLWVTGHMPGWLLSIILARDVSLVALSVFIRWQSMKQQASIPHFFDPSKATAVVKPTKISKFNTALQLSMLGLTLFDSIHDFLWLHHFLTYLQWSVAGTTIASGYSYLMNYKRTFKFIK